MYHSALSHLVKSLYFLSFLQVTELYVATHTCTEPGPCEASRRCKPRASSPSTSSYILHLSAVVFASHAARRTHSNRAEIVGITEKRKTRSFTRDSRSHRYSAPYARTWPPSTAWMMRRHCHRPSACCWLRQMRPPRPRHLNPSSHLSTSSSLSPPRFACPDTVPCLN